MDTTRPIILEDASPATFAESGPASGMATHEACVIAVPGPAPAIAHARNVLAKLAPTAIHPLGWTDGVPGRAS